MLYPKLPLYTYLDSQDAPMINSQIHSSSTFHNQAGDNIHDKHEHTNI